MNITKVANLDAVERFDHEWKGQEFWFEAKTVSLTPAFISQIGSSVTYPAAIAGVLTDWDIKSDDEGTIWPLTEPELSRLPIDFLVSIISKISDSWAGDKKKPQASQNGSAAAARSVSR